MQEIQETRFEELKDEIFEIVKCPLCFEEMNLPTRLPCGHSFCFMCLGDLHQQLCPVCRTSFRRDQQMICRVTANLRAVTNEEGIPRPPRDTPPNVKSTKRITSELLQLETSEAPQFPYKMMQKFALTLATPKEFLDVIVDSLGAQIEVVKKKRKIVTDFFIDCPNYPECYSLRCLHTLPWNMCYHGEACPIRTTCRAFHPVELMNLFFNVQKEEL
nr:expressed protein [Hymenolepis microstoma]